MNNSQFEFHRPSPDLEPALVEFFRELACASIDRRFHPHPFTAEAAVERAHYNGADAYYLVRIDQRVVGYGMLRGWDAGFAVPRLGIALLPSVQGIGLGRTLMHVLHCEAKRRGATRIGLKVYPDNAPALALYHSMGYIFEPGLESGQLVGHKTL